MSFPSSAYAISDDFARADGALGSNWQSAGGFAMTISNQQITGTSPSFASRAAWGKQLSPAQSFAFLVPVLPVAALALVFASTPSSSAAQKLTLNYIVSGTSWQLIGSPSGGSTSTSVTLNAGDGIGITLEPNTRVMTAWRYDISTNGPWASVITRDFSAAFPNGALGWSAYVEVNDQTVRLDQAIVETAPNAQVGPIFGHGAC